DQGGARAHDGRRSPTRPAAEPRGSVLAHVFTAFGRASPPLAHEARAAYQKRGTSSAEMRDNAPIALWAQRRAPAQSPAAPPRDAPALRTVRHDKNRELEIPLVRHIIHRVLEIRPLPEVFGAPALRPPRARTVLLIQPSA